MGLILVVLGALFLAPPSLKAQEKAVVYPSLKGISELVVLPFYFIPGRGVEEAEIEAALLNGLSKSGGVETIPLNDMRGFGTGFWLALDVERVDDVDRKSLPLYRTTLTLTARVKIIKTGELVSVPIWSSEIFSGLSQSSLLLSVDRLSARFISDFKRVNSDQKLSFFAFTRDSGSTPASS